MLPTEVTGLSSSILSLSLLTHIWYSLSQLLEEIDGDLGLCALSAKEWFLILSKLLPISKRLSKELTIMSISWIEAILLVVEHVVTVENVIFLSSLIGTCQDWRKWTWLIFFSFHFYFYFLCIFLFSIFRTTKVRIDQSYYHISHNLIV